MKKTVLLFGSLLGLTLFLTMARSASACDGHPDCPCHKNHDQQAETQAKPVTLEGTVVKADCNMKGDKMACTGAALAVGDKRHMILKGGKGEELVKKAKGTGKTVKVEGTEKGDMLTVSAYSVGKQG